MITPSSRMAMRRTTVAGSTTRQSPYFIFRVPLALRDIRAIAKSLIDLSGIYFNHLRSIGRDITNDSRLPKDTVDEENI